MPDDRSRLSLPELHEYDAWNTALRLLAMQTTIGQGLCAKYGLPEELPHRIVALLTQLNQLVLTGGGRAAHCSR
jgi:hypothetical protein